MALGPLGACCGYPSSSDSYEPPKQRPQMSSAPVRVGGGEYEVSQENEQGGQEKGGCFRGLFNPSGNGTSKIEQPPSSPPCFELQDGLMMRWPEPKASEVPKDKHSSHSKHARKNASPPLGLSPEESRQKVEEWLQSCSGGGSGDGLGDKHHEKRDNEGGSSH